MQPASECSLSSASFLRLELSMRKKTVIQLYHTCLNTLMEKRPQGSKSKLNEIRSDMKVAWHGFEK